MTKHLLLFIQRLGSSTHFEPAQRCRKSSEKPLETSLEPFWTPPPLFKLSDECWYLTSYHSSKAGFLQGCSSCCSRAVIKPGLRAKLPAATYWLLFHSFHSQPPLSFLYPPSDPLSGWGRARDNKGLLSAHFFENYLRLRSFCEINI